MTRAIAWCVGLVGLVFVPVWLVYAILISEASFFGEPPSGTSLDRAADARLWGRVIATSALVLVVGVVAWSFGRGIRTWGLGALACIGAMTTAFMWVA